MKIILILLVASFISAGFFRLNDLKNESTQQFRPNFTRQKLNAKGCSPDLASFNLADSANIIPLLDGWGSYRMAVTSANDSAEIFFQQGINMYYAFHVIESLASFERAVQFDSSFAMGYWGKALAYGPNINDLGYSAFPEALVAMRKAKALSENCTDFEKAIIDAMQVRYTEDTAQSRTTLNQRYSDALKKVFSAHPDNPDAGALYADAQMLLHPWDLYYQNFAPKPWTPELVRTLESVLKLSPDHPGAAHYYIHSVEASAKPERGLEVANKLYKAMPGVSHVVHMPSHIYIRSGYYNEGEDVNARSVKSYSDYLARYAPVANNSPLYLIHNLHMQATCANMDGRFQASMESSQASKNSFDTSWMSLGDFNGVYTQYVYMTPYLTLIRFGKWDEILNTPEIDAGYVFASVLDHYGRGLAYARKQDLGKAQLHLDAMKSNFNHPLLGYPPPAYSNKAIVPAELAATLLNGVIKEEQGNLPEAIAIMKNAVVMEDSMIYNEPKDWVHPVRQYLGNVLLKARKYKEAEKIFREDLFINPNNGWSLIGLSAALKAQGKRTASNEASLRSKNAFGRSDIEIKNSVF